MRLIFTLFLFLYGCNAPPPRAAEIEGTYKYTNAHVTMVLNIKHGGSFSWSISDKNNVVNRQVGKWELYDDEGENLRLIIGGFCFPPGVSRANKCTNEYPAIIEKESLSGKLSIPIDIDYSTAALRKVP